MQLPVSSICWRKKQKKKGWGKITRILAKLVEKKIVALASRDLHRQHNFAIVWLISTRVSRGNFQSNCNLLEFMDEQVYAFILLMIIYPLRWFVSNVCSQRHSRARLSKFCNQLSPLTRLTRSKIEYRGRRSRKKSTSKKKKKKKKRFAVCKRPWKVISLDIVTKEQQLVWSFFSLTVCQTHFRAL